VTTSPQHALPHAQLLSPVGDSSRYDGLGALLVRIEPL
jgi:hypothetical protein